MSKIPLFDPLTVPVIGVDSHLPAVSSRRLTPQALEARFRSPPAHWQPEVRAEPKFVDRAPAAASVLIPVVKHARPTVILTQRTAHMSSHSGQIALPGGKSDETDADAIATALRETEEEIGLGAPWVQVIGQLPVYTTGSAFVVTPVVALVTPGFELHPNTFEVSDVFEVPLDFLMDPANHRQHQITLDGVSRQWMSMPYQEGPVQRFIWGATAGMLRNLYRFLAY